MVGVRQFDEDEVIATALDVFWRKGLHDATMQDLAAATGVQRGSLYNAYGDKEAIFLRAFDRYTEQFLEGAGNALSHGDAAAGLRNGRKHRPGKRGTFGNANVETDLLNRRDIIIFGQSVDAQDTRQIGDSADDKADARATLALKHADLHLLSGLLGLRV